MQYKIIVDKQSRTNPSSEKKEYVIDIEELRVKGDVYDSLFITPDEDYVIRRLSLNEYNVLSVLPEPIKQPISDINIELFEGDNYIYLVDMTGNKFYAEYLIKNDFNNTFATRGEMNSAINQTAQSIELSVNQKFEGYSTTEEMNAAINVKANEINSSVNSKLEDYSTTTEMNSAITQKANEITSTVNNKFKNYSTTTQMNSAITQKANEITSEVSETYATKETTNSLSSRIKQTAKSIELTTSDKSTSAGITIKLKNEDGSQIDSKSANITMKGLVKFTDLSGAGSTTINGSNITTGTIDASKVTVKNINASNITSGTITGRTISGGTIKGTKITNGNNFSVDANGNMTCKNANIQGNITSSNANITGGKINLKTTRQSGDNSFAITDEESGLQSWLGPRNATIGEYSNTMDNGVHIYCRDSGGGVSSVHADKFSQNSLLEYKKNIEPLKNAKDIIKNADIYKYNMKGETQRLERKSYGVVIGDGYKTPIEILSKDNKTVNLYSMISIEWRATQELIEEIESLKEKITALEGRANG